MEPHHFINRINDVLKPQLQENRIMHISDICCVRIVQDHISYILDDDCSPKMRGAIELTLKREAERFGYIILLALKQSEILLSLAKIPQIYSPVSFIFDKKKGK